MSKIYLQYWEESERGWGQRSDGYSLHPTMVAVNEYIEKHWEDEKAYNKAHGIQGVPDEYSRPCGKPQEVEVSDELYEQVAKSPHGGLRFFENQFNPDVPKTDKLETKLTDAANSFLDAMGYSRNV